MQNSKKYANSILVAGFLICISLPLAFGLAGLNSGVTLSENRRLQPMPSIEINDLREITGIKQQAKEVYLGATKFIRRFDYYFNTTFSFRVDLLRLYNTIKFDLFSTDPLPQKVVRGRDGWYFLGDSFSNVIKESKGIDNSSNEELNEIVLKIKTNNTKLKLLGIDYYFAAAPNKASVYGDYLPIEKAPKPTTTTQLDSANTTTHFNFIDLKSDFSEEKGARLYYKTDSHWNDYGAYLGYATLIKKVKITFPDVPILSKSDFQINTVISHQQDLTRMLAINEKENVLVFNPKYHEKAILQKNQIAIPKNYARPATDYETRFKSDINTLKVLVFHDSFTTHLKKFIKESFGETVFIWDTRLDYNLIEKEKPDVVIQIIVERHLDLLTQY